MSDPDRWTVTDALDRVDYDGDDPDLGICAILAKPETGHWSKQDCRRASST